MRTSVPVLLFQEDSQLPYGLLRPPYDDWGLIACDLVAPPRRFWSDGVQPPPVVDASHDLRRLRRGVSPTPPLTKNRNDQPPPAQKSPGLFPRLGFFLFLCDH